jgi:hypothetical protein
MKMSNVAAAETPQKKTINDPIAPDTLKKLAQITNARLQLADQLLDLEQEKIKIMVTTRQLDDEKQRVFEKELTDRGLAASAPVEVDAKTGMISFVKGAGQPQPPNGQTAPQQPPPQH